MPPAIDLAGLLMLVGWNLLLYSGWVGFLLRMPWPTAEVLLLAAIGWCCQVLLSQVVLGFPGWLNPLPLVLLNLAVVFALFALGHATLHSVEARQHRHTATEAIRELARSPVVVASALLLCAWLAWTLWLVLIFPPYAADEHYYHMPIAATIVQQGRIGPIVSLIPWLRAYPKNGELFAVWHSVLLHRDTFADLAMLPFGLLGALAVYVAGRRLGAARSAAWLGACVFVFSPTVLIHMKTTYIDLLVGAMWAAGIALCLPNRDQKGGPSLGMVALAVGCIGGIIVGTKYTGVLYLPLFGLLLLPRLVASPTWRGRVDGIGLFALGICGMGGVWYIMNIVQFRNPVWPFELAVGGRVLLPGRINTQEFTASDSSLKVVGDLPFWGRLAYTWLDRSDVFSIDERLGGLGPLWSVIGIPAAALWGVWAFLQRRWSHLLVIACHGLLLLLTPLNWTPRYTLFLLTLGGCGFAAISPLLRSWTLRYAGVLVVVLAMFACVNSVDYRYFSVSLLRRFSAMPDIERTGMTFSPGTFGASYQWMASHTADGARLAFGQGVWRIYPLYGAHFEREVISLPLGDPASYAERLRAAGVHYILMLPSQPDTAALAASPMAKLVFSGDDNYQIYEILP